MCPARRDAQGSPFSRSGRGHIHRSGGSRPDRQPDGGEDRDGPRPKPRKALGEVFHPEGESSSTGTRQSQGRGRTSPVSMKAVAVARPRVPGRDGKGAGRGGDGQRAETGIPRRPSGRDRARDPQPALLDQHQHIEHRARLRRIRGTRSRIEGKGRSHPGADEVGRRENGVGRPARHGLFQACSSPQGGRRPEQGRRRGDPHLHVDVAETGDRSPRDLLPTSRRAVPTPR